MVVKLKEGSWFGDYQILLNVKSSFDLEAHEEKKSSKKRVHIIPPGKVQVFELDAEKFLKIINRYPEYRRKVLMRANLRRCHFMKVFRENKHIYLLQRKIQEAK